jgi:ribosomal-protein-alanine acetyltransferase
VKSRAQILVRRILPADVAEILTLQARCPEASQWSAEGYARAASGEYPAWVASVDGRIEGFMVLRTAADECEILNLAVNPERRRRGIASALLEQGFLASRAAGAERVFLEVRESNAGAIAFYDRQGFVSTARRARYYQQPAEGAVVMSKTLA